MERTKLTEDELKLSKGVSKELIPFLVRLHGRRLSKEECKMRVVEDLATVCCLIVEGHIILKHKEGSTTDDIARAFQAKNRQKDSSAQDKEPQDES